MDIKAIKDPVRQGKLQWKYLLTTYEVDLKVVS